MSDNTMLAVIVATCIASCTACSIADRVTASNERAAQTPEQACVARAWTQADRIECLKAKP